MYIKMRFVHNNNDVVFLSLSHSGTQAATSGIGVQTVRCVHVWSNIKAKGYHGGVQSTADQHIAEANQK